MINIAEGVQGVTTQHEDAWVYSNRGLMIMWRRILGRSWIRKKLLVVHNHSGGSYGYVLQTLVAECGFLSFLKSKKSCIS